MKPKKAIWIFALISITLLLVSLTSCGSGKTTFRDETVTTENKAEILSKANIELTVEEARLLEQYLKKSYPQLAENDLPAGRTLNQMIEEERIVESTRTARQAADETEAQPDMDETTAPPVKTETTAPPVPEPRTPPPARQAPAQQPATQAPTPARQPVTQVPTPAAAEDTTPAQQAITQVPAPEGAAGLMEKTQQASSSEIIPEAVIPEVPQPVVVEVESGVDIQVRLVESLNTETAETGDRFELQLAEDLAVGDQLIAPKGSRARGRVLNSQSAGKVKGVATISLTLTDLYVGEEQFPLQAETLTYEAEKTTGKDAAKVGVASGIGAIIGAIIGGGKGAAIGAGVGAGAGTTTVLATKGDELEFPVEQMFRFRLTEGFKVEVIEE